MVALLKRPAPRRRAVVPTGPLDPSMLPSLRLWAPSTGATGGGATAYASASSQYHFVTDKPALRSSATGIGIVGQFSLTTTAADQGLAGKCGNVADAAGLEYALQYVASAARFRFIVSNGTSSIAVDASTPGAPVAGTWYSIAAWYDPAGGGSLSLTVNDGAIDGIACPITPQGAAGEFRIGRVGAAYLNGRARNVAVLRRPPTALERTALHNGGAGVTYANAPASLVAVWSLGGWWDLAITKAGQKAFDQVRRPNLAPKTPTGTTRGTASPPAGFSAYRTFTPAATSNVGGIAITYPAVAHNFDINRGATGTTLRLRVRRADTALTHQALWVYDANGIGLVIKDNKLSWYTGSYLNSPTPTLSAGVWYDVGMTFRPNGHSILVVDGAVVHTWYSVPGSLIMDTLGGRTTTNIQTLNGDLCGAEYYQEHLSAADWANLHAGNPIAFLPFTAYRMDETGATFDDYGRTAADLTASSSPTPADPPTLTPAAGAYPVRRLVDLSGGGRHLTAPAAEPPEYAADSSRLPLLGMPRGIRCDQQGPKRLQATSVLGTVTEFTFGVAGLLSHPIDQGGLATGGSGKIVPVVGCSNNGLYGTAAGDQWAILGYQEGRAGNSELYWKFYFGARAAGGPTVAALAQQPHPFGHTLIARYKGGGASPYLSLAYNGVEVARTTASVPASLALTDLFTWGKVGSNPASGHQLHDLVVCNQAISDSEVTRLHQYWAGQMQIVPVATTITYDAGPWNGVNVNGFNQMAGLVKANNGEMLLAFMNSIADPSAQTAKIILQRSTDGGVSWDAGTIVADERPTYDTASGQSLFKLHTSVGPRTAGDIGLSYCNEQWNTGSGSYPPGSITGWVKWSGDHGHTWTTPTAIPTPAGFSDLAIYGRGLQRAGGEIWVTGYGQVSGSPNTWHSLIMKSADGGVTWTLGADVLAQTGGGQNTEMEVMMFDALGLPSDGIAVGRGAGTVAQTRTYNGGANWERPEYWDGFNVNLSYTNSTPNFLIDAAGRLISITGQRNVFYADDGKVVRWGLRLQVSLDRGDTWGPIVTLFDVRGRTNNGALIDGANLITASVDETGKIRTYRFPAAALPDVTTP